MHRSANDKPRQPWYRQGWPWFLIALPAVAVVAGIVTLVIAIQSFDGMVVDDYYKEGRAIVQTIERVEHARELGLRAGIKVRSASIHIELSASGATSLPERIHLTVAHPTRGGLDQELLVTGTAGVYEAPLAPLATGRWLFVLEDEARSWRMDGSAFLPEEMEITIDPNA